MQTCVRTDVVWQQHEAGRTDGTGIGMAAGQDKERDGMQVRARSI